MGFFDREFDPSSIALDQGEFLSPSDSPTGYPVKVRSVRWKETKAGTGRYLEVNVDALPGQHHGEQGTIRLNLENPNEVAVRIATEDLKRICEAKRPHLKLDDPSQLVGWTFNVCVREQRNNPDYTEVYAIRKYRPEGEGAALSEDQLSRHLNKSAGGGGLFGSEANPRKNPEDDDGIPFKVNT